MMDTTVINNPEDLARLLGVKDASERDLSNAVYHYTECGAWLRLNEVRAAERRRGGERMLSCKSRRARGATSSRMS